MLSILETEKRPDINKFFLSLLKDLFKSGKSKHHLYGESVIETLLSGLRVATSHTTGYESLTQSTLVWIPHCSLKFSLEFNLLEATVKTFMYWPRQFGLHFDPTPK